MPNHSFALMLSQMFDGIVGRVESDALFATLLEKTWLQLVAENMPQSDLVAEDQLDDDDLQDFMLQALFVVLRAERNM
jgi:hypothetical protein